MEIKTREMVDNNRLRVLLDASFEEVKKLLALVFDDTDNGKVERDSHRKYIFFQE